MKSILVSVYDKKAQFFDKPVVAVNKETAIRMIQNTFQDANCQGLQIVKTPADFQLFQIGTFDDNNGNIETSLQLITELAALQQSDLFNQEQDNNGKVTSSQ